MQVQKLSEDLDPEPVYGIKIGQNTVEIPLFRDVLTYADGIHDSVPMLPMLGIDFMVCDDGVYFMEANPMCSYSRYVPTLGIFCSDMITSHGCHVIMIDSKCPSQ